MQFLCFLPGFFDMVTTADKTAALNKVHPLDHCSLWDRVFFGWASDLIALGSKKTLEPSDMYSNSEMEKAERNEALLSECIKCQSEKNLINAVQSAFHRTLLSQAVFTIPLALMGGIIQVLCLKALLTWLLEDEPELWYGILLGVGYAFAGLANGISKTEDLVLGLTVGARAVGATSMLVFKRSMSLSLNSSATATTGSIVTLLSNDVRRVEQAFILSNVALGSVPLVIVALVFLLLEVGYSALAGFFVLLVSFRVQFGFARKVGELQRQSAGLTSERVRKMNELITGVQLVKFNAWEESVAEQVRKLRAEEAVVMQKAEVWKAVNMTVFQMVPLLSVAATFLVYVLTHEKALEAPKAFATLAWFGILRGSLIVLPRFTTKYFEARAGLRRIQEFLGSMEEGAGGASGSSSSTLNPLVNKGDAVGAASFHNPGPDSDVCAKISSGTFSWRSPDTDDGEDSEEREEGTNASSTTGARPDHTLQDVSLEVRRGQLVVVCGPIASGKSSLLAAALGEMHEVVMAPQVPPPPPAGGAVNPASSGGVPKLLVSESPRSATSTISMATTVSSQGDVKSARAASTKKSIVASVAGGGRKQGVTVREEEGGGGKSAAEVVAAAEMLTGDGPATQPTVFIGGAVAYVPQQAWILNATVRENITFGLAYDAAWFATVVQACCLEDDVENMAGGELTEIGEGGVTLSGGQKQRVSLARAVYRNADVYLLDDVLSALDAHVALQVFNQVVSRSTGLLKDKAVVMVTHALWCLPEADQVAVLVAGRVTAQGTFLELDRDSCVNWSDLGSREEEGQGTEKADSSSNLFAKPVGKGTHEWGSSIVGGIIEEEGGEMSQEDEKGAEAEWCGQTDKNSSSSSSTGVKRGDGEGYQLTLDQRAEQSVTVDDTDEEATLRAKGSLTKAEKDMEGGVSSSVYASYLHHAGGIRLLLCVIPLVVLSQCLRVSTEVWISRWANESNNLSQITYVWVLVVIIVVFGLSAAVRDRLLTSSLLRAGTSLHDDMFKSVLKTGMNFFWTNPSGRVLNRFSKEMDTVDKLLIQHYQDFFTMFSGVLAAIVSITAVVPVMLLPLLPLGYAFVRMARYSLKATHAVKRIESSSRSPVYSLLAECLQGLVSIRTFHAQPRLAREFAEKLDTNTSALVMYHGMAQWLSVRLLAGVTLFTLSLSMLVVFLTYYGKAESTGMSLSALGVALFQASSLGVMLRMAVRQATEVSGLMTSVERVQEYSHLPPEGRLPAPADVEGKKPKRGRGARVTEEDGGGHEAPPLDWPQEGCVEFRNVLMRYSGDKKDENGERLKPALKELNFKIQAQEKVGVVGRTGAGKSSLAMALFRIVELEEGSILIDDVDVSGLELSRLRSSISIIPQDPLLFRGPLRLNLDPFSRRSDEELWGALEKANLGATVRGMKAGLDSPVSENGGNFSVGQRQLLCLARALLDATKILLLDEATSNVDTHTDELIQRTVRTAFAHCTVVTIAHRLNTIIDSDKVLVMAAGRAKEFDAPARLLADPASRFSKLVDSVGPEGAAELRAQAAGKEETGVGSGKGEEV